MTALKKFFTFFVDIFKSRKILFGLAKNDFKSKFASSFLGILWAFIQPLATILVFWFVFEVGLRAQTVDNVPFIVWFVPAYLAWSFFSEALLGGTNCLSEYNYLVKKVNFRVSMIPVIKIISSMFVHVAFIGFIFFIVAVSGVPITIYAVQIIYYFLCTCALLLGLCWLLSAIAPFLKDMSNIVNVVIQIGFWATPISWDPKIIQNQTVQNILKLNPMYYICRGYRDCFVDQVWFWQRGYSNIYFWAVALLFIVLGAFLFQKLRPQFADVL